MHHFIAPHSVSLQVTLILAKLWAPPGPSLTDAVDITIYGVNSLDNWLAAVASGFKLTTYHFKLTTYHFKLTTCHIKLTA